MEGNFIRIVDVEIRSCSAEFTFQYKNLRDISIEISIEKLIFMFTNILTVLKYINKK